LTNAGGAALLAADALITSGGELAQLAEATLAGLEAILPNQWSHGNPVDVFNEVDPARFARAVELVRNDPGADGLLLILAPQAMVDSTQTAERLRDIAASGNKPILASWMGGVGVLAGQDVLNKAGIPTFDYPDAAARAFRYLWKYSENLESLRENDNISSAYDEEGSDRDEAAAIGHTARLSGRTTLDDTETRRLLAAYGLPTMPSRAKWATQWP
jgi:acetyltransferase